MVARDRAARLFAVGDIYFNRPKIENAYRDLEPLFRDADFRFCNYEAPITNETREFPGRTSFNVALRSPLNAIQGIKMGLFDVVSLANNHMLDYGIEGLEETLAFMDYPIEHWARIKTTNLIERLNAELKRRIDVIRIFPNTDSALRLIGCLCLEQHEEWISTRKYLEMEPLYNSREEKSKIESSLVVVS